MHHLSEFWQPDVLLENAHLKSSRISRTDLIPVAGALAAALLWLFFVSHGFSASAVLDSVYVLQARSFNQGHLYILPGPDSAFYHDVLLYKGRYYFYQGLLPPGLLLLFSKILGWRIAHYLTAGAFLFSFVFFVQKIICLIIQTAFRGKNHPGGWVPTISVLLGWLFIFVLPFPVEKNWFFGRFIIYEQQIIFGLALAIPGVYFLIKALEKKSVSDFGLAAVLFSLAAWTRITWFPYTLGMLFVAPFFVRFLGPSHAPRALLNRGRLLLLTALLLTAAILLINYLRFDAPFDFGLQYQNTGGYVYLRNLKLVFAPEARLWNTLFNLLSYYLPEGLIEHFGLVPKSYSHVEYFMPSFFARNPQFLAMLLFIPLGLYKTFKNREPLGIPLSVMLMTTIYLNLILCFFGSMVILRYFIEFYCLLMLTFFASLLAFMRLTHTATLLSLMLVFYMPAAAKAFVATRPLTHPYQTGDAIPSTAVGAAGTRLRPEPKIHWPVGKISSRNFSEFSGFCTIGLEKASPSYLMGRDLFAVYLIPEKDPLTPTPTLTIKGLSAREKGKVHVFIENILINAFPLSPGRAVDYSGRVSAPVLHSGPYQILVVFTPGNSPYLPTRITGEFELAFVSIQLTAN